MALARSRPPIPDPEPVDEARQLVGWLRDTGVDRDVADRLDQVVDDLALDFDENEALVGDIEILRGRVHWLEEKLEAARDSLAEVVDELDDKSPTKHRQVTVPAPHWLGQRTVDIDEGIVDLLKAIWAAGLRTDFSCQGDTGPIDGDPDTGHAWLNFGDRDQAERFLALVPGAFLQDGHTYRSDVHNGYVTLHDRHTGCVYLPHRFVPDAIERLRREAR
jgi:hypothetical protein